MECSIQAISCYSMRKPQRRIFFPTLTFPLLLPHAYFFLRPGEQLLLKGYGLKNLSDVVSFLPDIMAVSHGWPTRGQLKRLSLAEREALAMQRTISLIRSDENLRVLGLVQSGLRRVILGLLTEWEGRKNGVYEEDGGGGWGQGRVEQTGSGAELGVGVKGRGLGFMSEVEEEDGMPLEELGLGLEKQSWQPLSQLLYRHGYGRKEFPRMSNKSRLAVMLADMPDMVQVR